MKKIKRAILLEAGYPVGLARTSAAAGDTVCYGVALKTGGLHQLGRAKISRAKKYMDDAFLLDSLEVFQINLGGGTPI
jgi:hypothetical protein